MKRLILIITTLCIISCSDTTIVPETVETGRREEIAFSMSTDSHFTRSAATRSMVAFANPTRIVMRMECHNKYKVPNTRYTRTTAVTNGSNRYTSASGTENYYNSVTIDDASKRYWNNVFTEYGKDSFDASFVPSQMQTSTKANQIEVFAVAIPGLNNSTLLPDGILASGAKAGEDSPYGWGTNNVSTLDWTVSPDDMSNYTNEDLVYSNNIREDGVSGVYRYSEGKGKYVPDLNETVTGANNFFNGRMLFSDGNPDKGHLIFKHALTRLTVVLKEGDRFDKGSSSDFQFTISDKNIEMLGAPCSGTLDIKTGEWSNKSNADVLKFAKTVGDDTDASGTYLAQILPGYKFAKGSETVALQFTIDGDTYEITQGDIFAALKNAVIPTADQASATSITMEAGANYTLNIKVNKYKVSVVIDAMIAPWEFGGTQGETFTKW